MYRLNSDDSDYGSVEESDFNDDYEFEDDSESEEDYESEEDNDAETETESELENDDDSDCEEDDFDSVLTYLAEHDSYDGIFIRINSFINNFAKFPKSDFDRIIEWALSMKKLGKTIVLISDYILPHFDYLSKEMDFVINFIPREDLTSTNRIYCSAQWLKHRKLSNKDSVRDGAAKSSSSSIHDHIIASQTKFLNFDGNMPYFTMVRATANRDRATGWHVNSLK